MSNSNHQRNATANKMLIDATHPEETRVVVLRHGRVEEFDYESAARKLLRGNIYLAKVTRVEPSLQAAFVDYGGNRHGFLAFNEIHPDYYQIPIADRRALIEAEAQAEAEEEAEVERAAQAASRRRRRPGGPRPQASSGADEDGAVDATPYMPAEHADTPPADVHEERPDDRVDARHAGEHRHDDDHNADEPVRHVGSATDTHDHDGGHTTHHEDTPRVASERTGFDDPRYSERAPEVEGDTASSHAHREGHDTEAHGAGGEDDRRSDDTHRHDDHEPPSRFEARRDVGADARSDDPGLGEVETIDSGNGNDSEQVETVSSESEDALEELQSRPRRRLRSYKIQEVIKRRQVILVQVVKEERGNKGAALTTYLSLAGRYTVLMPNTARGGGISRKITNAQDRKRLKAIADELEVEDGMGLIIRTAGAARTKQEIKRDYEYLLRLWESVRDVTLASVAPTLVYEEGNLIKRSIRDLYGKDVEEVVVAGAVAHHEAKDFMRMLMPSHAKNVINYEDSEPLFSRYQIERQLNAMFSPYVHLRSGGYLVINQTEALVAVDVNSGKSTREFSIEETAYATNLEAADEIARQLKLRDLAGLIVVDFIDMEEKRNNRAVERRLKDALRFDRARIQVGHISHFGLLEMSRQRLRTGVLEGSTTQCPHCQGTGIIRSTESVALAVLRGLEDALMTGQPASLIASTTATVALYILNNKRAFITEMEARYGITIQIVSSDKVQGANFGIERLAVRRDDAPRRPERAAVSMDWGFEDEAAGAEPVAAVDEEDAPEVAEVEVEADGARGEPAGDGTRRRRRRRGRGRRDDQPGGETRPRGDREPHANADSPDGGLARGGDDDGADPVEPAGAGRHEHVVRHGATDVSEIHSPDNGDDADGEAVRGSGDRAGAAAGAGEGSDGQRNGNGRRGRRRGRRGGRRGERGVEGGRPELSSAVSGVNADFDSRASVDAGRDDNSAERSPPAPVHGHATSADDAQPSTPGGFEAVMAERARSEAVVAAARSEPNAWQHQPPAVPAHDHTHDHAHDHVHDSGHDHGAGHSHSHEPAEAVAVAAAESAMPPVEPPAPVSAQVSSPAVAAVEVAHVSPRRAPVASEPVLERVVVGPHAAAAAVEPVAEEARPVRRGWWQRK